MADPQAIAADAAWKSNLEATQDIPVATGHDIVWADGVIFGTPTRYGSPAWQFRAYIDSLTPLFMQGLLVDKVYTAFTSGRTEHGGQESTLLAFYTTLMHFSGILVPPGFTDDLKWVDGNPYGVGHVTGLQNDAKLTDATIAALRHLARRIVSISARLNTGSTDNVETAEAAKS